MIQLVRQLIVLHLKAERDVAASAVVTPNACFIRTLAQPWNPFQNPSCLFLGDLSFENDHC